MQGCSCQAVVRKCFGSCQAVARNCSVSCQKVFRQFLGSHQTVVRKPSVVGQLSGSCQVLSETGQVVVRQLSESCQAVIRQLSGSCQAIVSKSSDTFQAVVKKVIRQSSNCHSLSRFLRTLKKVYPKTSNSSIFFFFRRPQLALYISHYKFFLEKNKVE